MLEVKDLHVSYGHIRALHGIDISVSEGEVVCLIGSNGAGKSTLLRAISGMIPFQKGSIQFCGKDIKSMAAHEIVTTGIAHVPEGRGIFSNLSVLENLKLATWIRKDKKSLDSDFERIFHLFPVLKERLNQSAGTLSGGEQQMLSVSRALLLKGKLLLLDEPSMGLAPRLVKEIFRIIKEINQSGTTVLIVEQNAKQALALASRAYLLETGTVVLSGKSGDLSKNPRVQEAYLG